MYILVLGNPVEGFKFEGLFTTTQEAVVYGEQVYPGTEWWTAKLTLDIKYGEHVLGADPVYANGATNSVDYPPTPATNVCACGHDWSQHQQNVHGMWVCGQCNCRNMDRPSEIPQSDSNRF